MRNDVTVQDVREIEVTARTHPTALVGGGGGFKKKHVQDVPPEDLRHNLNTTKRGLVSATMVWTVGRRDIGLPQGIGWV